MRLSAILIRLVVLAIAGGLSIGAAHIAVERVEKISQTGVAAILARNDITWAIVEADGLLINMTGVAPTEAMRFRALSLAGEFVDAHRVIDNMNVQDRSNMAPPRFVIEILRNDTGISLIGLISTASDRTGVVEDIKEISDAGEVTDMLEEADYPVPEGWGDAMEFSLYALERLPRSKISVSADLIIVTAITDSAADKARLERLLNARAPEHSELVLDLSAPRPVITPFTLRFVIQDGAARFDACSADRENTRARILAAARAAGLSGQENCTIGLGQPSPHWADAVVAGIGAVAELGAGTVTYSDADVTLIAPETVSPQDFDRAIGELEAALPDIFELHAVLQEPEVIEEGTQSEVTPEFTATLSPEGYLQLRGRLTNERERTFVESFSHSRWGIDEVYGATRLDENLPSGWSMRVLAALESLAHLKNGHVVVTENIVSLRGITNEEGARAEIARILSSRLGAAQNFTVDIDYVEPPSAEDLLKSAEECIAALNATQETTKIRFDPGSTSISVEAIEVLDAIADIMKECEHVPIEIGGHTDSQGREQMNLNLSQARADSVLNALMARRVRTINLIARGYGETNPIADNETEEGREENRRITFTELDMIEIEDQAQNAEDALEEIAASEPAPPIEPEEPVETAETTPEQTDEAQNEQN